MEYFTNTLTELFENYTKHPIIFIAITERVDLKPNMMRIFLEKIHIPKLKLQQRFDMLKWYASVMNLRLNEIDDAKSNLYYSDENAEKECLSSYMKDILYRVASKTETFAHGDLDTLMHFALRESYLKQNNSNISHDTNLYLIEEDDFNSALGMYKLSTIIINNYDEEEKYVRLFDFLTSLLGQFVLTSDFCSGG